jgi:hypothetical protein
MGIFQDYINENNYSVTLEVGGTGMVTFLEEGTTTPIIRSGLRAIKTKIESLPQRKQINLGLVKYENKEFRSNRMLNLSIKPISSEISINKFVESNNLLFDDRDSLNQIANELKECINKVVGTDQTKVWKFITKE